MTKNVFNFFPKKIIDSVDNFSLISVGVKWETTTYINFFFGGGGGCKSLYRHAQRVFLPLNTLKSTANAPTVDPPSRLSSPRGTRSGLNPQKGKTSTPLLFI